MSGYTALCSRVVFPLHERVKGHDSVARLHSLEESQWWTAERIEEARFARLKAFLEHARAHVPYYREKFAVHGFEPDRLRSTADLALAPFLTKADIRAAGDRLRSDDAGVLTRYNTGGSSGEPLVFYIGRARKGHDVGATWRAARWWGVDIGDPELVVWGSPVELTRQDRIRQWRDRLLRTELLPAFDMSPARLDGFVARLREARPKMLFGYPSALALIAQHAERRGVAMAGLGV
ncbi:MAG: phenylacetate--CoA ligase family protein, partial [Proteobacteria bacterium]|nr:phenylacetate--CoA ligase family protein [Pseudomonadota bacterium]